MRFFLYILIALSGTMGIAHGEELVAPDKLLKQARVDYRGGRFAELFGVAYYARQAHPVSGPTEAIRLLEILSLIRHCQWKMALDLSKEGASLASSKHAEDFLGLIDIISVAADLPEGESTPDTSPGPGGLFGKSRIWKIKADGVMALDPFRLRRKVEPLCKVGARSNAGGSHANP